MATIETLQKRIDGAKKNIAKMEQKIARILKAKESGWVNNPYYYSEDDIRIANKDLAYLNTQLARYEESLAKEIEKASSRNVPAILEFLENWKERVFDFYCKGLDQFYAEKEMVHELYKKYSNMFWDRDTAEKEQKCLEATKAYEDARDAFDKKCRGYYEKYEYETKFGKRISKRKIRDGEYEYLAPYSNFCREEAIERLKRDLENEANRKYDFIIERVNSICGTILDASGLSVGAKGDLNGVIVGEKGNAHVQTIGAGGYNIQVFHFRTLIKEIKR